MGDTTRCLSQDCTDIAPQASMHHTVHSSEHPPAPFAMEKAVLSLAQDRTSIAPPSSIDFAPRFSQGVPASLDLSARATSTSISIGRKGGKKGRRTKTAATPRSEKTTGLPQVPSVCSIFRLQNIFQIGPTNTSTASDDHTSAKNTGLEYFASQGENLRGEQFSSFRECSSEDLDGTLEDVEEEKYRWEELRMTFEGYAEKGGSEDNDFDEISAMFNKVRLFDFDKFKKFPDFPVELRLKIWFRALPEARVIELERSKFGTWHCPRGSPALKCSLLLVNTESRHVFLKYYKKIVGPLPSVPALLAHGCGLDRPVRPCCPIGYYCPEIDTTYIGPSSRIGGESIRFESDAESLAFDPLDTLLYSQNREVRTIFRNMHTLACSFENLLGLSRMTEESRNTIVQDFPQWKNLIVIIGNYYYPKMFEFEMLFERGYVEIVEATDKILFEWADMAWHKSVVENEAHLLPFEIQIKAVQRNSAYRGIDMVKLRKSLPDSD